MKSKTPASCKVKAALDQFRRGCWVPRTKKGEGKVGASRFGGRPAIRRAESWPTCGICRRKMPLFVQIDLAASPHLDSTPEALRSGLLQLLFCTSENCESQDFGAFTDNALARVISAEEIAALKIAVGGPEFPAKQIAAWVSKPDVPGYEEATELGIKVPEDELDNFYAMQPAGGKGVPLKCDKLYGWPFWVQGRFYPPCRKCKKQMTYIFQLGSEDNIPFMLGDAGIGHVCICPKHPERASFYWSCC
ncbi:MAG: DUF1963 domain-containing protein [Planctomycetes bacterium]|nr:DUF1963 domain-containing protein [Planctomycetota bacterium]